MKARVLIFYKPAVFDPQGNTICSSLNQLGFSKVKEVRAGKILTLEVEARSTEEARMDIKRMCEKLLVNPVIETFEIELEGE